MLMHDSKKTGVIDNSRYNAEFLIIFDPEFENKGNKFKELTLGNKKTIVISSNNIKIPIHIKLVLQIDDMPFLTKYTMLRHNKILIGKTSTLFKREALINIEIVYKR